MHAVIFDIGGVLAKDVWERLLPAGIEIPYGFDPELVRKVGKLQWDAFATTPESPSSDWRQLEERYWKSLIEFFWEKTPPSGVSAEKFIEMFYRQAINSKSLPFLSE